MLQLAPMLLQLTRTGGKLQHFRCGHISLHHIATIDDIYLNDILYYAGSLPGTVTGFKIVIIFSLNTIET